MIKDYGKTAIIAGERRISYSELLQKITIFSQIHVASPRSRQIILAENREAWIYAFFGIWHQNGIAVPVDASSTPHDIAYILNDCQPECIWTTHKKADLVTEAFKETGKELPLIYIDDYEKNEIPANTVKAQIEHKEDDTALIIYTSGTTGSPKGVMLSFANLWANLNSVSKEVKFFGQNLRTIILLPLHHVLPLQGTVIIPIITGDGVAICPSLSASDIMDTLQKGEIGMFVGVPRLWQTLYMGIRKKLYANPITKALFNLCYKLQWRWLSKLVFHKVQVMMGGHLRFCISGGAALDKDINLGLRAIGLNIVEGYGMTECAPIIAFDDPVNQTPGSVGKCMPSSQVKIIDGEICTKGPNLMQGYYNRPEETAQVIDSEGWLHTGDLGYLDDKGRIFITGRRKEIIVLSNGKNVQPSEIEYKLEQYACYVKEAGIVQDGDMLRAIIVPEPTWAKELSDEVVEETLKREVLEPYNLTVAPYKKLMSLFVYRGDLPRTKMDKLQRFKLPKLLIDGAHEAPKEQTIVEPSFPEYKVIAQYIRAEKKLPVKPTDHIETDLAFDSLDKIGLQGFLEATFGMEITADQIVRFKNITEMAEYVADYKTRIEVEKIDWGKILHEDSHDLQLPQCWRDGLVIAWFCKMLFKLYFRFSYKGLENVPTQGPFILAPNHQSYLDGMFVMCPLPNKTILQTYFYAKSSHVNHPYAKWMASIHNTILMEPTNLKTSIQRLGEVLKCGRNIMIFPEGTRTEDGKVATFKKTFAILSQELNVPIIPVCISGAFEAMPKHSKFPRPHKVEVEFLPPILPTPTTNYDSLTETTRNNICKVL